MRAGVSAAVLVCLLGDGSPVAAQTAGAPQAPASPTPSSSGGLRQWPATWLDLDVETRQGGSAVVIGLPLAQDVGRLPKGWSFRFESPATDGNAPWRTGGALAWQVGGGGFGVRVTGQRGARLPLFMTPPGSSYVPRASDVMLSDSRTQWQVTLSAERTMWTSRGGGTWSLFGDLFLPLGSIGRAPATEDVRTPPQTAFIGGVRIRWKAPPPDEFP
jgi:hypothetical protein